jgi:hypothetical protein
MPRKIKLKNPYTRKVRPSTIEKYMALAKEIKERMQATGKKHRLFVKYLNRCRYNDIKPTDKGFENYLRAGISRGSLK